jgi:DNA modification methylase
MTFPEDYIGKVIHGDCLEVMRGMPDKCVDLVLTDPPYGMNNNPDSQRFSGGGVSSMNKRGNGGRFTQPITGDDSPFDPSPFLKFNKVILWGYNHFASRLPVGTTLVWIKRFDGAFGTFLSDAELAWMKGGHGVYCKRDTSMAGLARERVHPNEKPLALMKWCIERAGDADLILDPFCGSGTTLVAAKMLGRRFIGIDIEERYVKIAEERLRNTTPPLPFTAEKHEQGTLL